MTNKTKEERTKTHKFIKANFPTLISTYFCKTEGEETDFILVKKPSALGMILFWFRRRGASEKNV